MISMSCLFVWGLQAKSCTDAYCYAQKAPVEEYPADEDKGTSSGSGYDLEETDFC